MLTVKLNGVFFFFDLLFSSVSFSVILRFKMNLRKMVNIFCTCTNLPYTDLTIRVRFRNIITLSRLYVNAHKCIRYTQRSYKYAAARAQHYFTLHDFFFTFLKSLKSNVWHPTLSLKFLFFLFN